MEFPEAIREVAKHAEHTVHDPGHVIYGWKVVQNGFRRYTEALSRHLFDTPVEAIKVDDHDLEQGEVEDLINSATTVAWNAMARLELLLQLRPSRNDATNNSHAARDVV
jgi:phytoene dehydrogenase-like protein